MVVIIMKLMFNLIGANDSGSLYAAVDETNLTEVIVAAAVSDVTTSHCSRLVTWFSKGCYWHICNRSDRTY